MPAETSAPRRAASIAGVGFMLVSSSGYGLQGIFTRFAYRDTAGTLTIGLGRFLMASALLWGYLLVWNRPATRVPRSTIIRLLALGSVGYFLASLTYLVGVRYIPVALASFIAYLYPALATMISIRLGRDRISRGLLVGLAVTLLGLGVMLGGPLAARHGADWRGVGCMMGNAAVVALYIVTSERVLPKVHAMTAMAYIATGAAVSNAAAGVVTGTLQLSPRPSALLWIAAIGVICTAVAAGTQLAGLRRLGPARTATLSTLEALITLVVAWIVLRERLSPVQLAGGLAILLGIIIVIWERSPVLDSPRILSPSESIQ